MSTPSPLHRFPPLLVAMFESPRLSEALTLAAVGTATAAVPIRRLIGIPGLFAILAGLVVLMGLSFLARRHEIELRGLLPLSLLGFLGWTAASIFWSEYQWASLGGLVYLAAYTLLGFYIALARDTIQILRSVGDVVRVVLGVSLGMEILSGILIDTPIPFLDIEGNIAQFGPISGILGTRNLLGLVAIVGAVTTVIEWRTRSVTRFVSWVSAVLCVATILLTRSPVTYLVALVVAVAFLVMYGIRRVSADRRTVWQIIALVVATTVLAVLWSFRTPLVAAINATGEFNFRLNIWQQIVPWRQQRELQGWGWLGRWDRDLLPYSAISAPADRPAGSASNAFLDVWLQVGLIGLALFVVAAGLAFTRSWLLAGQRRSIVYAWPAAVLVALLFTGLAESTLLYEFGWMLFVICCVKASQELSWRRALEQVGT
jgi:hypothetical protein